MPRGGDRGGRRPKGFDKEQARLRLRMLVLEHADEMTKAQISHAVGVKYLVYREKQTGKFIRVKPDDDLDMIQRENVIEVYDKDPSIQAFTDLMNRTIDMPAKPIEDVNLKGAITISWKGEKP